MMVSPKLWLASMRPTSLILALALGVPLGALGQSAVPSEQGRAAAPAPGESICLMVEAAARANALPIDFFARVIWQESRFQPEAVGPVTRSGARAQGIAQFMPGTAAERRLLDPFNPIEALPKSAAFLAELRDRFGNLGLAAAAYNAGPQRVHDFIAGTRGLPVETRNYVLAITGHPVDDWTKPAAEAAKNGNEAEPANQPSVSTCRDLMALLKQAPNPFVEQLQQRIDLVAASPWGVQLSAGFSRDHVLVAYANIAKRFGEILAGHDPSIFSGILRSRGTRPFYQVRIGAPTRADAKDLCAKIAHTGGACFVLRNSGTTG
jgi:Transglycosylase SLT domain/SPOR domain